MCIEVCQYDVVPDRAGVTEAKAQPDGILAGLFKALSDPVRVALYTAIAEQATPTCVCDLPDVGVAQPTVSHHLRKLREAGLIEGERRGLWVYYRAVPAALAPITAFGRAHASSDETPHPGSRATAVR